MNPNPKTSHIINSVVSFATKNLSNSQSQLLETFIKQFYADVIWSDFENREIDVLSGSAIALWNLVYKYNSRKPAIEVFNPNKKKDGWESESTIVVINQQDMPFLVDSLQMAINRLGLRIYSIIHLGGIHVTRDSNGKIVKLSPIKSAEKLTLIEAPIYIEISKQTDTKKIDEIKNNLISVLNDVGIVVADWDKMREQLKIAMSELGNSNTKRRINDFDDSQLFLQWLLEDNFIFFGYRKYTINTEKQEQSLTIVKNSGLGVLADESKSQKIIYYKNLPPHARKRITANEPLILYKTDTSSTIHRDTCTDSIVIKCFDAKGNITGMHRFVGLYANIVYNSSLRHIPLLRNKVDEIVERFGHPRNGYAAKSLINILEKIPRDDFFQTDVDELYKISVGIFQLQERPLTRLFVRKDIYARYVSCLVYLPRDNFNTELRIKIQNILLNAFSGTLTSFDVLFSESILTRVHFQIKVDPTNTTQINLKKVEQEIIEATTSWRDSLERALMQNYADKNAVLLLDKYHAAFSAGYREKFTAPFAVADIAKIEEVLTNNSIGLIFYNLENDAPNLVRLKLFQPNDTILLSKALPILENFGFQVISEESFAVIPTGAHVCAISDFILKLKDHAKIKTDEIKNMFEEAFTKVWNEKAENDGFNKLLLTAQLNCHEIEVLRAYAKYLHQIKFSYSQQYLENALVNNFQVSKLLLDFFKLRFDPRTYKKNSEKILELRRNLEKTLELVTSFDEDKILNRYLSLIQATLRTNYYQNNKEYFAFKISCSEVPELPLPSPLFEIFVYSPYFEGTHLRMAKVARGGLRWSDRREDFRTEILGLMKAQQVKNVVIVPSGAKGGFVLKSTVDVITCYKNFVSALLDLTDNIIDKRIVSPVNTACHDDSDPYLVVAADKGTATFSDTANSISNQYNFWLGDAFASGGSSGYDHKKIGITAKGAWESVKYNFYEKGIDVQKQNFTVVGIGDMSGDVFGNGMILSEHIKLIAAFNHMHIFLDPNPDSKKSYQERLRLFRLEKSTWDDYAKNCISTGGGVYNRNVKLINLSQEIKKVLDIKVDRITPNDLIKELLKAPVDLLWNGGIGTYIKSSEESNEEVGDKNNDAVRVDAKDLRCKLIAEGGNLGLTQLARIEYSLHGGVINTDFIDNSGGVDCSDHEVNLKILLNQLVKEGVLNLKDRNKLLVNMTKDVEQLVLQNNYRQVRAIASLALSSGQNMDSYIGYLNQQEQAGKINRELEFLPNNKILEDRKSRGEGLTRPEIAVLLAYAKLILKAEILQNDSLADKFFNKYLQKEFPDAIAKDFMPEMLSHKLRKEIISTHLVNDFVTNMGITFAYDMQLTTNSSSSEILKAYIVANEIFSINDFLLKLEEISNEISPELYQKIISKLNFYTVTAVRWILANLKQPLNIADSVAKYKDKIEAFYANLKYVIFDQEKENWLNNISELTSLNIPAEIANYISCCEFTITCLNACNIAVMNKKNNLADIAKIYFILYGFFDIGTLFNKIEICAKNTSWNLAACDALQNDLNQLIRELTMVMLKNTTNETKVIAYLNDNIKEQTFYQKWQKLIVEIKRATTIEFSTLYLSVRELLNMDFFVNKAKF